MAKATGLVLGVPEAILGTYRGTAILSSTSALGGLGIASKSLVLQFLGTLSAASMIFGYILFCDHAQSRNDTTMTDVFRKSAKDFDEFSNKSPKVSELSGIIKNGIKKLIKK